LGFKKDPSEKIRRQRWGKKVGEGKGFFQKKGRGLDIFGVKGREKVPSVAGEEGVR